MFNVKTSCWTEINNDQDSKFNSVASTIIVPGESIYKTNVYVIGGNNTNLRVSKKDVMKFSLEDFFKKSIWLLHFLNVTRFNRFISINLHENLVSMYEGKNLDE